MELKKIVFPQIKFNDEAYIARTIAKMSMNSKKCIVCYGLCSDGTIEPNFFNDDKFRYVTINSERYRHMYKIFSVHIGRAGLRYVLSKRPCHTQY